MTETKPAGGGLLGLFEGNESAAESKRTDEVLLAETLNDAPFVSLAYANLVVFSALLFCLAGLQPYTAIAYVCSSFCVFSLTAFSSSLVTKYAGFQPGGAFVTAMITLNELALTSILVFDYFSTESADGFVAIISVVSISFLSVPLFARFSRSFLVIKFGVIALCVLYALTTPFTQLGASIAIAALVIAYLLIAAMGYWIVTRRREDIHMRSELTRLNRETAKARDKANADFALRQRLLSYIGHDLRQPISAARFILHNASGQTDAAHTRNLVKEAEECIHSAGRMIEDLVQITHYNSSDIEVIPEQIFVDAVLLQAVRSYNASTTLSDVSLRYVPCSLRLNIDPELLSRIVNNLLRNARKHSGAKAALLGVRRRATGAEIWVVDNGRGLSSARENQDTKGLGIGLEISKQLAQACGANLELVSIPGRGTCCRLKIPKVLVI